MTRNVIIRSALWATVALNLLGVAVFLPAAMGRPSALLPIPGPPYYIAQVALVIGLFCGVYAWLASQRVINRPLLIVGALGKLGFFLLAVIFAASGDIPSKVVPQSSPDLLFAIIFLWWAFTEPKHERVA
ncbi:MAG: hypothetical protein ABI852_02760 [Gemmatimonadaceae bacterium]